MRPGPGFAMLRRGELRLLLKSPGGGGGAGQRLSRWHAGQNPAAGTDFSCRSTIWTTAVDSLRKAGVDLRGDVITGRGGRQALVPDPAGNLVELFQPFE